MQLQTADARPDRDRALAGDPGILELTDIDGLLGLIAPRPLLLLSATDDPYSADAPEIVEAAIVAWETCGAREQLKHIRYEGGHALTRERFGAIIDWVTSQTARAPEQS